MPQNAGDYSDLWIYKPSIAAAAISTVIFALLTGLHIFRVVRSRSWFCIPFVIGAICKNPFTQPPQSPPNNLFLSHELSILTHTVETIGYAGRIASPSNANSLPLYILQTLTILLAPILFAASVYMVLSRLIVATGAEAYTLIRVSWITRTFVGGDILCFLIQSGGGGILAGADDDKKRRDLGQNIILAGLILQMVIFVGFVLVAVVFHRRLRARPTGKEGRVTGSWERALGMLYTVSVLITVRNLFQCWNMRWVVCIAKSEILRVKDYMLIVA
jgi:hypothetical protein